VSAQLIVAILAAPAIVAAVVRVAKRLSTLDLEIRTHRVEAHLRYLQASNTIDNKPRRAGAADVVIFDSVDHRKLATLEEVLTRRWNWLLAQRDDSTPSTTALRLTKRLLPRLMNKARAEARPVSTDVPIWALALLGSEEAKRYAQEWAAHLDERVREGELREARIDRRRLTRSAIVMAMTTRLRTARGQLRRRRG